ncbi:ergothioneine biosynthesis protein EgtB [Maribacter polysiphoniae]|uniref:Ergothioneine biosynthesis protein EgtB n=1 Tax=Maribacter polysiphoniae TaxID=429344 RepID=A0A316DVY0_9FLAO|nr:ergothioneine biosynthesis protein EgtB [Maribacter polysiphoniae]MBD1261916.1 ergothioneine biosynthesis protein EgtB [Maribacter polysiphoniae]PWK22281.1 ergothioneine biosynthesis protein EgtB [Maribacter polysiphoniae]
MSTPDSLLHFFLDTRKHTEAICQPLEIEDYVVQPVADVSPPKWHLGHSTWFFEEFILKPHITGYKVFDNDFSFVFNSYYESVGEHVMRSDRGNLSRPSVEKVYDYRAYVTKAINDVIEKKKDNYLYDLIEMGIHHEKQHQELLLTDIKYILGNNPLLPLYSKNLKEHQEETHDQEWIPIAEGIYGIGHDSENFSYDNELGRHKVYLNACEISNKLVTNQEFIEFIQDKGYQNFELWHAEGWDWVNKNNIKAPLYWHEIKGEWFHYTLNGLEKISTNTPITHISYFEAFAFAQWKGYRLPTEFEWETAQHGFSWGQRWEWTESAYLPYPNYKKAAGALGEYNGKFMVNQKVLRGGSVATPIKHTRPTYRNFFPTHTRWQYNGIRLAR